MSKEPIPILSNEFLNELTKEINELYGGPMYEQTNMAPASDSDEENLELP